MIALMAGMAGELLDIHTEIELGHATELLFTIRGERIQYNVEEKHLSLLGKTAHLEPVQNKIELQILVDRTSIEAFGNGGRVSMSSCFLPDLNNKGLGCYSLGGEAKIIFMNVYEMSSVWF